MTIFFLHFHKCGGTTINKLMNKKIKFNKNQNGNPINENKREIRFWNFNKEKFNEFKQMLKSTNVEFVAFEWNFFKNYEELELHDIELITCFRDPYDRFLSNMNVPYCLINRTEHYIYDTVKYSAQNFKWINAHTKNFKDFGNNFYVSFNKFNYYVRKLCSLGNSPHIEINENHLKIAKERLKIFSTIIILENADSFKLLEKFGVDIMMVKNKNNNKGIKMTISRDEFDKLNYYDIELYKFAIELSNTQIKCLD
jgi:hypothetical protein